MNKEKMANEIMSIFENNPTKNRGGIALSTVDYGRAYSNTLKVLTAHIEAETDRPSRLVECEVCGKPHLGPACKPKPKLKAKPESKAKPARTPKSKSKRR